MNDSKQASDYPLTFDEVRLSQHLRFRSLSAKQKIAALEDMEKIAALAKRQPPNRS